MCVFLCAASCVINNDDDDDNLRYSVQGARYGELSGVSSQTQRTQRISELTKSRKLQPIRTELSPFHLNSFLRFKIKKKINRPNFSTRFTCCATYDANQV